MKKRNIAFGYSFENGRIVINQYEYDILKRICAEYIEGSSLMQIANGLIADNAESTPGITAWDKAKIARIVDDDRYLGTDAYPQLIDKETVTKMREIKASRNTQSGTNRSSGIYLLKAPVICSKCGSVMKRLNCKNTRYAQKWVCGKCDDEVRMADSVLLREITDLLNLPIRNPDMIEPTLECISEPTAEHIRIDNEIARTLEEYDFDKAALREKLFQRVAACYKLIGNESYTLHKLKCIIEKQIVLDGFDADLVNSAVKEISIFKNGSVRIKLINNQIVEKE